MMKECIITSAIAITVLVIFFMIVNPMFDKISNGAKENVNEEFERFDNGKNNGNTDESMETQENISPEQEEGNMVKDMPYVDPKAGTTLDGPGFEKGEVEDSYQESPNGIPSNYYFLDDGADGEMSIQHNLCSKSCCGAQYPTPHKLKHDPYVCQNKDKFTPSNIYCNNSFNDSGCLCLSKKQASFLYNRGGNGREWF